jgi:Cu-processing system permease protein
MMASYMAVAAMIGSSVLLGAAFISLGYFISTVVRDRDRGTAAGIAIGVWLVFVLLGTGR